MIDANQFHIQRIQCTIVTPNIEFHTARVLAHLLDRWGQIFDGEPLTIPLPSGTPPEIPSIILTSSDGSRRIELARARTNVVWARTKEDDIPDVLSVMNESREILQDFTTFMSSKPGRLATVVSRFLPIENPAKILAEHFCRREWLQGPLNRPDNFELHAHKRFKLANTFTVNSWFRVKTGFVIRDNRPALIVEQDINTLAEEQVTQQFSSEDMQSFFDAVRPESDQILAMYFHKAEGARP